MTIDKPLKYFFIVTGSFLVLVGIAILGTLTQETDESSELPTLHPQDSLLLVAKQKASETIDTLRQLYPLYPEHTFVKFARDVDEETSKHIWGKVIELDSDHVTVELADPNNLYHDSPEEVYLAIDQMEDWIVEVGKGKVRGGFTTQVILIREKEKSENAYKVDSQLQLFLDPI